MRLGRKITLAFFLVRSVVSVLLAVVMYRFLERELLGDRFTLEDRGEIDIKGKGIMRTFLISPASAPAALP